MSLLQQAYLLEKYGLRLGVPQLAEVLGIKEQTVHHRISQGTLGIHTYVDGKQRWADVRDVATYFDDKRAAA
jgi:DNA-directed RNA polymerase specialized sigma24 family protein